MAWNGRFLAEIFKTQMYRQKCSALLEHVYESYPEADAGVYFQAG